MGNDGGSIPTRADLVKVKEKKREPNPEEFAKVRWNYCALSNEPLKEPIVADELGNLFNKETVLKALFAKKFDHDLFPHIRGLKDFINLRLTPNPNFVEKKEELQGELILLSRWICPVTLLETNGHYRFYVLRGCGCVLSEKAIREVPTSSCLQCGKPFNFDEDAIMLVPVTSQEQEEAKAKMLARRESERAKKKEKKEKRQKNGAHEKEEKKEKKQKHEDKAASPANSAGAKLAPSAVTATSLSMAALYDKITPVVEKAVNPTKIGTNSSPPPVSAPRPSPSASGESQKRKEPEKQSATSSSASVAPSAPATTPFSFSAVLAKKSKPMDRPTPANIPPSKKVSI